MKKLFPLIFILAILISCGSEEKKDPCDGVYCNNYQHCSNGTCYLQSGRCNYSSDCSDGYMCSSDNYCRSITNPCETITCNYHGTCYTNNGEPFCNCDSGYEKNGLNCIKTDETCRKECTSNSDCNSGYCANTTAGKICLANQCKNCFDNNQTCNSTTSTCIFNYCENQNVDETCKKECTSNSDCNSGYCVNTTEGNICLPNQCSNCFSNGQSCKYDNACNFESCQVQEDVCQNLDYCVVGPMLKFNTPNDSYMTSGCAAGNGDCCYLTKAINQCNVPVDFRYCLEKNDGNWTCGLSVIGVGKEKNLTVGAWEYNCSGTYGYVSFEEFTDCSCFNEWKTANGIED